MVDSVNAPMASGGKDAKELSEHDAAMLKVADDGVTSIKAVDSRDGHEDGNLELDSKTGDDKTDDGVTQRPDDIPEKFWNAEKGEVNVEALLKAQKDGEEALRASQNKSDDGKTADDAENTDGKTADDAENKTGDQSTAVAAASDEFAENGELSPETYKSLEATGLSKEMVDEYIEGQQAIMSGLQTAAFGEFEGGKETYDKAVDWAVDNLSEEEIQAIDVQITSRNPGIVKQGAAALAAKFAANADITPDNTVTGQGNNANAGAHFKSSAEMRAAMSDARYKTDPAFRKEVENKIAGAGKAGVNLF